MKNILLLLLIPFKLFSQQNDFKGTQSFRDSIKLYKIGYYNTNQGSSFTTRSLVDKGYVDSLTTNSTYNPTLTNVTNVTASTSYSTTKYFRVGSMVTVFGKFQVDPTAAGATEIDISLPIASNLSGDDDVAGIGSSSNITGEILTILADATNDRARVMWTAVDVTNRTVYFQFSYQIK